MVATLWSPIGRPKFRTQTYWWEKAERVRTFRRYCGSCGASAVCVVRPLHVVLEAHPERLPCRGGSDLSSGHHTACFAVLSS